MHAKGKAKGKGGRGRKAKAKENGDWLVGAFPGQRKEGNYNYKGMGVWGCGAEP